jgi:hypothetical protein
VQRESDDGINDASRKDKAIAARVVMLNGLRRREPSPRS